MDDRTRIAAMCFTGMLSNPEYEYASIGDVAEVAQRFDDTLIAHLANPCRTGVLQRQPTPQQQPQRKP